jgi:hypothetical protein
MAKNYNLLGKRREALSAKTKIVCEGLSADGVKGWGSYKINTHCTEVLAALTCPNLLNKGHLSHGVVLLWNRTMEEANA